MPDKIARPGVREQSRSKPNPGNRSTRRGHRPAYLPSETTARQVEALASYGIPQEHVARIVGIGEKTLRKYYAEVLAIAQAKANSLVAQSLFNRAIKGDGPSATTAAIFWLKTRAGWRERDVHEITGTDGGPIKVQADVGFAEFAEMLEQAARLRAGGTCHLAEKVPPVLGQDEDERAFRSPHLAKFS